VAGPVGAAGPLLGRVASFDAGRGLGTVTADEGTVYDFHATAIADGTRRIDVGHPVSFTVAPGHRGRYEVRLLVALGSGEGESTPSHQRPA
jgi:cold shock CspA family protein